MNLFLVISSMLTGLSSALIVAMCIAIHHNVKWARRFLWSSCGILVLALVFMIIGVLV